MASRKQIAAAKRNIKKAQAALRAKFHHRKGSTTHRRKGSRRRSSSEGVSSAFDRYVDNM